MPSTGISVLRSGEAKVKVVWNYLLSSSCRYIKNEDGKLLWSRLKWLGAGHTFLLSTILVTRLVEGQKLLFFWVETWHHTSHRYRLYHPGMSILITDGELATFEDYLNTRILEYLNSSVVGQIWARDVSVLWLENLNWVSPEWKSATLSVLFSKHPLPPWERSTLQWTFQGLFSGGQEFWILNCPQRGVIPSDVNGFPQRWMCRWMRRFFTGTEVLFH